MTRLRHFCALAAPILLTGCAGLDVHPLAARGASPATVTAAEKKARGFRYYEQAPFLFIKSDGKGGLESRVIQLNTSRKMSARPYAYGASADVTLAFSNGALTEASITGDETAIPVAIVDALAKAAVGAIGANAPGQPAFAEATVPTPYLFRIQFSGNTVKLIGGPAIGKDDTKPAIIKVTLVPTGDK